MQPLKYDANGRVLVDAAAPIVAWANGLPFTADGALAVSGDLPVVEGLLPFDADARVTVGEDA